MMLRSLALACLAAGLLPAAEPRFFIQLTDPQMGMFANNADTVQDEMNLKFAVANVNRLKPSFVVVCGDLVNIPGDATQVGKYREIMATVDKSIPVYHVAGNHDVGNQPSQATLTAYRKALGPDYYTFDSGDIRGIVLDSNLIKAPENAPEEAAKQERWLQEQLQRARRENVAHVLVFQHIPFFLTDPAEPDQYFNIPTAARRKYLDWFHQYGVTHVFAGHYHRNAFGKDGDLEMITNGPVGKPLGQEGSGLRVVRVTKAGLEHHYYDLGSIPHVIE